jgi:hypothetical protein
MIPFRFSIVERDQRLVPDTVSARSSHAAMRGKFIHPPRLSKWLGKKGFYLGQGITRSRQFFL